jgi:hypothetical protein
VSLSTYCMATRVSALVHLAGQRGAGVSSDRGVLISQNTPSHIEKRHYL